MAISDSFFFFQVRSRSEELRNNRKGAPAARLVFQRGLATHPARQSFHFLSGITPRVRQGCAAARSQRTTRIKKNSDGATTLLLLCNSSTSQKTFFTRASSTCAIRPCRCEFFGLQNATRKKKAADAWYTVPEGYKKVKSARVTDNA